MLNTGDVLLETNGVVILSSTLSVRGRKTSASATAT